MSKYDIFLMQMICGCCSVGLLYEHRDLIQYLQCEFCGFTILKTENEKRGKHQS